MANETIVGSRMQVGRVVAREQARRRVDEIRELVLADVPGHVRELLGELVGELEGDVEAGLEVGVEHDRSRPAARTRGCRSRCRRSGGRCSGSRSLRGGRGLRLVQGL